MDSAAPTLMESISAICVSHPSRFGLLQRAVLNFQQQTYPAKELVIAVREASYGDMINGFLRSRNVNNVTVIRRPFRQPIDGWIQAAVNANGKILVNWDDDDLSYPERLWGQLSHTTPEEPSVLASSLYYFYDSAELYVTSYGATSGVLSDRCAAASFMFYRDSFPGVDNAYRGSAAALLLDSLAKQGRRYRFVTGEPRLFMVGVRGDNIRGYDRHRQLATSSPLTRDAEWLAVQEAEIVTNWLAAYTWSTKTVDVCGADGTAFQFLPSTVWPSTLEAVGGAENGVEPLVRDRQSVVLGGRPIVASKSTLMTQKEGPP